MKLIGRILLMVGMVAGFATTFGTLVAIAKGHDVFGLDWVYWAMIGFTIFCVSIGVVLLQQHLEIKRLCGADKKLEREAMQIQIKKDKTQTEKNERDMKLQESMYGEIDLGNKDTSS